MRKPNTRIINLKFGPMTDMPKRDVRHIVIHHSGVNVDQSIQTIHNFHANTRGWAGVGYHFVIRFDGTIEEGRPLNKRGVHAGASANPNSIAICVTGNFEQTNIRPAQLKALTELVAWLQTEFKGTSIKYHNDFMATACPGRNFPRKQLEDDVNNLLNPPSAKRTFLRIIVDGKQVNSFTVPENAVREAIRYLEPMEEGTVTIQKVVL